MDLLALTRAVFKVLAPVLGADVLGGGAVLSRGDHQAIGRYIEAADRSGVTEVKALLHLRFNVHCDNGSTGSKEHDFLSWNSGPLESGATFGEVADDVCQFHNRVMIS